MHQSSFKDLAAERRVFQSRALQAFVLVIILLCVLLARLYVLQVKDHDLYRTISENNRVQVLSIPPTRGLIYDRNGVLLAENRPVFGVTIIPERVQSLDDTLQRLRDILAITEEEETRLRQRIRSYRHPFVSIPLRSKLTETEIARLAVHRHELPGVEVEAELVRYYPYGSITAHALGYVSRINEKELQSLDAVNYAGTNYIGKLGVEKFYENQLHGRVGFQYVETNARGRVLRVLDRKDPTPGLDLTLSLDIRLQQIAVNALGERRGAVVAIDPKTGGILALVSTPGYDANQFVTGIDTKSYNALRNSPDIPLFNRALRGQYPPGSTIKPLVALAGLDAGVVTPASSVWDPGYYQIKGVGRHYRDWKKGGHGRVNLYTAISESCDIYFYDLAYRMGVDDLSRYLAGFGLGEVTVLDLGDALPGILPSREWKQAARKAAWYPGDSVNMGIGQGYMLTTPLQLATAMSVLANRGGWHQPRMLMATSGTDLAQVLPPQTRTDLQVHNDAEWDAVIDGMIGVVHGAHGTARKVGATIDYQLAGKSGTAQVVGIAQDATYDASKLAERHLDHALFVGFAPANAPTIVVAVIIENGSSGSGVAAPVLRDVISAWLHDFPDSLSDHQPQPVEVAPMEEGIE